MQDGRPKEEKRRRPEPAVRGDVVLVEPSKKARDRGEAALRELGATVRPAAGAFEAHALVDHAQAVIAAHPEAADLYPRLRASELPFIVAFGSREAHPAALARSLGADAFVVKPYQREELAIALYALVGARLLRDRARRAELALADLSGGGRDGERSSLLHLDLFKTLMPLEIRRARRHGYPIAICVVALDPLPTALRVKSDLAAACEPFLRSAVRDVDLAVRYGQGRFLVFLPHTDLKGAEVAGKRIVDELRNCRVQAAELTLALTASVGIASPRPGQTPSFARLIRDAHAAVRAAQLKGGDQAIVRR